MAPKRLAASVLLGLTALIAAACSGDGSPDGRFSADVRNGYLEGCLNGGSEAFCRCTLEGFEASFSQDEFRRLGVAFSNSDEPPAPFVAVISACLGELQDGEG